MPFVVEKIYRRHSQTDLHAAIQESTRKESLMHIWKYSMYITMLSFIAAAI